MLMWILALLVVAALVVIGLAASRPNEFSVVRETDIAAPAATVHALLNDFHQWKKWSPWEELDPSMSRTYSGADAGKGAAYGWTGNKKVGEGSMLITGTSPSAVAIDLNFIKPFAASNKTVFTLAPASGGTRLRWEMTGRSPFMFKLMGLFTSMDRMIGKDFEKGLAKLKAVAEQK